MREARVLTILEECRRLLACQVVYFIPGCPEPELRHPLLDVIAESAWPVLLRGEKTEDGARLAGLRVEEPVLAACDLAIQRGRLQILEVDGLLAERRRLRSVAALPLVRPAGTLGVLLLADQHGGYFGAGEERLLYAYVSMHGARLERELWQLIGATARAALGQAANSPGHGPGVTGPSYELISLVGHELRAPLSIIKGYAGLLQAYGDDQSASADLTPERRRHYLQVMIEQSNTLELLVNDLLDMARLQRGTLRLRPQAVDLGALCKRVVQLEQWRANQRETGKHQLICRLSPHLPPVLADPTRLQQVLTNVVENAVKYSPQGGSIVLEAAFQEQPLPRAHLVVRDQGLGIPARSIPRLFRPFERLGQAVSSSAQGLGLGLYITHQLVTAMNGTIEIQSCEGHGTDVTITLPVFVAEENRRAGNQNSDAPFAEYSSVKHAMTNT